MRTVQKKLKTAAFLFGLAVLATLTIGTSASAQGDRRHGHGGGGFSGGGSRGGGRGGGFGRGGEVRRAAPPRTVFRSAPRTVVRNDRVFNNNRVIRNNRTNVFVAPRRDFRRTFPATHYYHRGFHDYRFHYGDHAWWLLHPGYTFWLSSVYGTVLERRGPDSVLVQLDDGEDFVVDTWRANYLWPGDRIRLSGRFGDGSVYGAIVVRL